MRRLTPEQLFQSLLVATGADHQEQNGAEGIDKKIQRMLREYLFVFGDDEMTEINTFNGNIPQALLLFNGEIVNLGARAQLDPEESLLGCSVNLRGWISRGYWGHQRNWDCRILQSALGTRLILLERFCRRYLQPP